MGIFKKKIEEEKIEERYILCLDGGGMRGIVPAVLLDKLAQLMKAYDDKKPFYSHFDLIAGTSTGGLLALALTVPPQYMSIPKEAGPTEVIKFEEPKQSFLDKITKKPTPEKKEDIIIPRACDCSKLLSLYSENGSKIFPNRTRLFGQMLSAKYRSEPLENFLQSLFNEAKMSQCLVPTMTVAYELIEGKPYVFKSWDSKDFYVKEAARATSAAPTYFAPVILHERATDKKLTLIDGGMVANNPVILAYGEAKKLYPNCKKFHIISLSTATQIFRLGDGDITGSGVMGWIDPTKGAPIQKIYASSQMQMSDYMAYNNDEIEYTRVDYEFESDNFKIDDTTTYAIEKLEEAGNIVYEKNEERIMNYIENIIKKDDFSHITSQSHIDEEDKKVLKQYKTETYSPPEDADLNDKTDDSILDVVEDRTLLERELKQSKFGGLFKRFINTRTAVDNSNLLPSSTSSNETDQDFSLETTSDSEKE
ncbi:MAG: patatin-like phospholipase family protein [Sphaerochaeta sp.]